MIRILLLRMKIKEPALLMGQLIGVQPYLKTYLIVHVEKPVLKDC